jgi:hypothetical protein
MTISEAKEIGLPIHSGTIYETGERAKFVANGYWIGPKGRHITSYERVDVEETPYRQYSRDRYGNYYIETED